MNEMIHLAAGRADQRVGSRHEMGYASRDSVVQRELGG
jgi:hypothetical protein